MAKRPTRTRAAGSTPAAQAKPAPTAAEIAALQAKADLVAADKAGAGPAKTEGIAAENAIQAAIADALADGALADPAELGGFDMDGRTILVRSVSPLGRRRGGLAFGQVPVPVAVDDLSEDQLAAILGDTDHLVVTLDS